MVGVSWIVEHLQIESKCRSMIAAPVMSCLDCIVFYDSKGTHLIMHVCNNRQNGFYYNCSI